MRESCSSGFTAYMSASSMCHQPHLLMRVWFHFLPTSIFTGLFNITSNTAHHCLRRTDCLASHAIHSFGALALCRARSKALKRCHSMPASQQPRRLPVTGLSQFTGEEMEVQRNLVTSPSCTAQRVRGAGSDPGFAGSKAGALSRAPPEHWCSEKLLKTSTRPLPASP